MTLMTVWGLFFEILGKRCGFLGFYCYFCHMFKAFGYFALSHTWECDKIINLLTQVKH